MNVKLHHAWRRGVQGARCYHAFCEKTGRGLCEHGNNLAALGDRLSEPEFRDRDQPIGGNVCAYCEDAVARRRRRIPPPREDLRIRRQMRRLGGAA
jgi:hypothetical protein